MTSHTKSDEFIFVYGTLRKIVGTEMHSVLAHYCEYHSDGEIQGRLYEVEGYPGVVESEDLNDTVKGELYKIECREKILPMLDDYEMCTENYPKPHPYTRKKVSVTIAMDKKISAWVYIYNYPVSNLLLIASGDYLDFLQ